MTRYDMIMERVEYYGVNMCEELKNDLEFILSEGKREGNRIGEVLRVLEEQREGITGKALGEVLGLKASNIASIIMEARKRGIEIFSVNGKYILSKFVNIGG